MKYIDFEKHHYGMHVTYREASFHAALVENKKLVADLTVKCYNSCSCTNKRAYAFVDMDAVENLEAILAAFKLNQTGRHQTFGGKRLVEYDFTPLMNLHNREMKRDKMLPGVLEVTDSLAFSTSLVYYIYRSSKKDQQYQVVTTDGWIMPIDKKHVAKAVQCFNVPVYKSYRKEPYDRH